MKYGVPIFGIGVMIMLALFTVGNTFSEAESNGYFPPPESQGGWQKLVNLDDIRRLAEMDTPGCYKTNLNQGFK
jgi:hypothetical protein